MSEQEGFLTDVRTAELFFRTCKRFGIKSRENRILLMREIVRRKKARYLRDVEPFIRGKRVLKVELKPHNAGPEHRCPRCTPENG